MSEVVDKPTAPYLPYSTFFSFIESLRGHPLPQRIDKSLMQGQSGGTQSQLMTCLRFLGLVTTQDSPTAGLKSLVAATTPETWAPALAAVVRNGYKALDSVDLMTITSSQLEEEFRGRYGSGGETLEKAVRFYLKCLSEAKINYSPRLSARQARSSGTRRATRKPNADQSSGNQSGDNSQPTQPPNTINHQLRLADGRAVVLPLPTNLTKADVEKLWKQLTALRSLVEAQLPDDETTA